MPPRRQPAPTLRLRRLASQLRRLRVGAGLTRDEVSERTGIDPATLYRIEAARAKPQMRTLMTLAGLYGVTESGRDELRALTRQSAEQAWLQQFADLPQPYAAYIAFESEAKTLVNYESMLVPGLLQTEDYARAALQRGERAASPEEIQRLVTARMSRQSVLDRDPPLRLWIIVDEAVLRRPVGGRQVMADQLDHIAKIAGNNATVTVQVIAYDAGGHAGMSGSFAILGFDDPAACDLVYLESRAGGLVLENDTDLARFKAIFEDLQALALPPEDSVAFIRMRASDMKKGAASE
ncbi:MAG TPA: helix-turn-helix transcriptional regulator [Streptosporangiaceae bacterium]|jgi:transcriptional regulator with XRE-family HTH domain